MNHEEFRRAGYKIIDDVVNYYQNIGDLNALANVKPGFLTSKLPDSIPEESESFEEIRSDFHQLVMPGVTHWQSANFYGYVPCATSYPSILAEIYCNMLNAQNFDWVCNPAGTELETVVMRWLGKLLGLDDVFDSEKSKGCGSIHSTASEATLVSMAAARNKTIKLLKSKGELKEPDEMNTEKLILYCSDQAHTCFAKNAQILNLNIKTIETDETGTMQSNNLKKQILSDIKEGFIPFYLGVCYGTTSVGSVDNILECIPIAQEHDMWIHVDAVWAGSYLMLPQYQTLNGFRDVDSIVFNPRKLMLINCDCTAFWTKNKYDLADELAFNASYYENHTSSSDKTVDYKDLEIPMGRRFRSLKLWFVMRSYGAKGLKQVLINHLDLTQYFITMINRDNIFEITHPVIFSLVCCRMKPQTPEEPGELTSRRNKWIFDKIFEEGKFLVGHATFRTQYILRISIGNNQNTTSSLSELYSLMKDLALQVDKIVH